MLGRRLVDVRFFHGHVDSAIDLAEDILYNLRQAYGPSHQLAVQMMNLLSSIYMSKGDRAAALAVHEAAVPRFTSAPSHDCNDCPQGGFVEHYSGADPFIRAKIEDLRQSCRQEPCQERIAQHSASFIDGLTRKVQTPAPQSKSGGPLQAHQLPVGRSFKADEKGGQRSRMEELA